MSGHECRGYTISPATGAPPRNLQQKRKMDLRVIVARNDPTSTTRSKDLMH